VKILFPALFICMGCLFLLVSTIFYSDITWYLLNLQEKIVTPSFWNLSVVLSIVRIIFIIVGIFLTCFGIGLFGMRRK
jgi:hypothetical protein